ncbi:MAG: hypothetical protein N3F63_07010 [Thermoplasmata archaeon]|nr:hypothetical protein [Thermoplasmata archaeon]
MLKVSGDATDGYCNGTIPSQSTARTLQYYITAIDEIINSQSTSTYSVIIQPVIEGTMLHWAAAICISLILAVKTRKRKN